MDKLIAAEILKVSEDASVREIKKAYARMLREYHPEEYPEEFKRIQEAYEVLTNRENGSSDGGFYKEQNSRTQEYQAGNEWHREAPKYNDVEYREPSESRAEFDYSSMAGNEEETEGHAESQGNAARDMEFERAEWKAQQQELLRKEAAIELAAKELEMIVNSRSLKHRLDSYEKFLRDERYRDILFEDGFILKACEILECADLKKEVYNIFASAYHFREYKPEQLKASAQKFYKVVDAHCKISKKQTSKYYLVYAAILPLFRGMRSIAHNAGDEWIISIVMLAAFAGLFFGYRILVKYYTRWRIHIMYSLLVIVSQIIMLGSDVYRKVLGFGADGDVIGVVLLVLGIIYFAVTAVAYVISKICRKFKRKNK